MFEQEKRSKNYQEDKLKAKQLFDEGKYKEVILLVDSMFGFHEGELGRSEYTEQAARWCLKQLL